LDQLVFVIELVDSVAQIGILLFEIFLVRLVSLDFGF